MKNLLSVYETMAGDCKDPFGRACGSCRQQMEKLTTAAVEMDKLRIAAAVEDKASNRFRQSPK